MLCGISPAFARLFPTQGQIAHALLTRAPLYLGSCPPFRVRLACVRHAASVRSEPGSNSPLKLTKGIRFLWFIPCSTGIVRWLFLSHARESNLLLFSFQRTFRSPRRSWYRESPSYCQERKIFSLPGSFPRLVLEYRGELCSSLRPVFINNLPLERQRSHYKEFSPLLSREKSLLILKNFPASFSLPCRGKCCSSRP